MDGWTETENLFLSLILRGRRIEEGADSQLVREVNNLKLWRGESELINTELPVIHINITKSLSQNRVNPIYNSLISLLRC